MNGIFQDLDFIFVLQTGLGSGFLPLGSGLESNSKKLESEHLWWLPEVSVDRIRIGYPISCRILAIFFIRIGFGYLFFKKIESGQVRIFL